MNKMDTSALFLGGCRSGKSGLAQQWLENQCTQCLYIATAQKKEHDAEMEERIKRHQQTRGEQWLAFEVPWPSQQPLQQQSQTEVISTVHALHKDVLLQLLQNLATPAKQQKIATCFQSQSKQIQKQYPQGILIDCITLWLTYYVMLDTPAEEILQNAHALGQYVQQSATPVALVSNELGSGIVPATKLGRAFRDLAGEVNQILASYTAHVTLVVAGLPLALKTPTT